MATKRSLDDQIGPRKSVRITEATHRDHLGGPGPDAVYGEESGPGLFDIGGSGKIELPLQHPARELSEGRSPRLGDTEMAEIRARDSIRSGE